MIETKKVLQTIIKSLINKFETLKNELINILNI